MRETVRGKEHGLRPVLLFVVREVRLCDFRNAKDAIAALLNGHPGKSLLEFHRRRARSASTAIVLRVVFADSRIRRPA